MNTLLLAKAHSNPVYVNPLYIDIAGNFVSGLLLSFLIEKFDILSNDNGKILTLSDNDILKNTVLFSDELTKAKRKLNKLPFISIIKCKNREIDTYTLNILFFNEFIERIA